MDDEVMWRDAKKVAALASGRATARNECQRRDVSVVHCTLTLHSIIHIDGSG